jgi:RimJ/RimL family protein N-acetyltransferase
MAIREPFESHGLWFTPLGPQWLELTRSWRGEPRVREQFHDQSAISYDEQRRWFEETYQPSSSDAIWIFGDEQHGVIGQVSLYEMNKIPLCAIFGRLVVGREDMLGRGYGERATRAVVERAFQLGFARVTLDVKPTNERAIRVYRKVGFFDVGTVDGSDSLHMACVPPGALTHSVIVGSYNRPRYIAQTLESIVTQTGPNWQLLVSDDASSDGTIAVIRRFKDRDPRCHLLETQDRPLPGVRPTSNIRAIERINDAIVRSTGEIIHYIPDDDFFAPGRFLVFESIFHDPNKAMGYGRLRYVNGEVITSDDLFPGGPVSDPLCRLDQSQVAHRRSCFDRVPLWPTNPEVGYVVDGIFYRMLVDAGYGPIWPVDQLVSYKRRHTFNMQHTAHQSDERRE